MLKNRNLMILLALGNLISFIIAALSYRPYLAIHPPYAYPFLVLCPLYIGAFTLVLVLYLFKKEIPSFLASFAFIGTFSYGFVSIVFYSLWIYDQGINFINLRNLIGHPLIGLESLLLIKHLKPLTTFQLSLLMIWFLLEDYFDLFQNTMTYFTPEFPYNFKIITIIAVILLQISAFLILIRRTTTTKC